MRLSALIHLVKIIQAFARDQEIIVLGSASLLGSFPNLGDQGQALETTYDADLLLEDCDEAFAQILEEAVGSDSLFQRQNG